MVTGVEPMERASTLEVPLLVSTPFVHVTVSLEEMCPTLTSGIGPMLAMLALSMLEVALRVSVPVVVLAFGVETVMFCTLWLPTSDADWLAQGVAALLATTGSATVWPERVARAALARQAVLVACPEARELPKKSVRVPTTRRRDILGTARAAGGKRRFLVPCDIRRSLYTSFFAHAFSKNASRRFRETPDVDAVIHRTYLHSAPPRHEHGISSQCLP